MRCNRLQVATHSRFFLVQEILEVEQLMGDEDTGLELTEENVERSLDEIRSVPALGLHAPHVDLHDTSAGFGNRPIHMTNMGAVQLLRCAVSLMRCFKTVIMHSALTCDFGDFVVSGMIE